MSDLSDREASRFTQRPDAEELTVALIFQAGAWRFTGRCGSFGRYAYKVDALQGWDRLRAKLTKRGWSGPIALVVQQWSGLLLRHSQAAARGLGAARVK